jgi:hypothetical protein
MGDVVAVRDEVIAAVCRFVDTCLSVRRLRRELHALENDATPEMVVKSMLLRQDLAAATAKRRELGGVLMERCTAMLEEEDDGSNRCFWAD